MASRSARYPPRRNPSSANSPERSSQNCGRRLKSFSNLVDVTKWTGDDNLPHWTRLLWGADDFHISPPFGFSATGLCANFFNKLGASPAKRRRDNALQQCQGIRRQGHIV